MRYSDIKIEDMNNGPGLRITMWVCGCEFKCPGCFNEKLWNFKAGDDYTQETEDDLIELLRPEHIHGLTLLGGEPLHEANSPTLEKLVKRVREELPNKTIWSYTGNRYEKVQDLELVKNLDVLIDGLFVAKLYDPNYKYAGSTNQRVIDIKKTMNEGKVVIYSDDLF